MHDSAKCEHGYDKWSGNCDSNDKPKGLEEGEITEEQAEATSKCGETPA